MSVKYPLAVTSWSSEEITAIQKVVDSGFYSMGKFVEQYEKDFSKYLGSRYSVMCSSGSTANLIMVASLFFRKKNPLKRGDEVIVPAVSWSTTYYPLQQYGLKVKFVDIDAETLNFDLDALENAITPATKLILAVNLLGNPNDFARIRHLCESNQIELLEDNCESLGATFEGIQCGTFGIMGTFSSFFSHHISTMEGGLVCTNDEELYHILLCLRAHGWTRNLPKENKVTGTKSDIFFDEAFKFVLPGYNVRPLEMSGAIGIEQLKKLPSFVEGRRKNAKSFVEKMRDVSGYKVQREVGKSSWFGFSLILDVKQNKSRQEVIKFLTEHGIECRPIVAGNFAKNSVLQWFDYTIHGDLKNADLIDSNGFFIGNHHVDMESEINFVVDKLKEALL